MSRIPEMDWKQADVVDTFLLFKQKMELYCADEEITDNNKIALKIKRGIGSEGLRRLNTSGLSDNDLNKPTKLWNFFTNQLKVNVNFRIHRLELMQYRQRPGESIDDFVTRCKTLALKCEFEQKEMEERILELLITSTHISAFQRDLLSKDKGYTLAKALSEGRKYEAIAAGYQHIQDLHNSHNNPSTDIHAFKAKRTCGNCGRTHKYRQCPAHSDQCRACGAMGHWEKFCRKSKHKDHKSNKPSSDSDHRRRRRSKSRGRDRGRSPSPRNFNSIENQFSQDDESDSAAFSYDALTISQKCMDSVNHTERDEAFTTLKIQAPKIKGTHNLKLKIDTGAQGNTLPIRTYHMMYGANPSDSEVLQPIRNTRLTAYNGQDIRCIGTINILCKFKDSNFHDTQFFVVDVPGPAVVGLPTCDALRLVTINCDLQSVSQATPSAEASTVPINSVEDLKSAYPTQFDTIGNFEHSAKLHLKDDAEPFIDPPRKTSIHMRDRIKAELESMEQQGVIRRITEHTDWCSSITYSVKKNNTLRICLDPQKLNQALKRCPHKIPTVEELNPAFANATVFSKLDAKAGYWSVHLDPDSQLLTTFRTPFGRYCWTRLPFGLKVSQDIFQQHMDEILETLPGVVGISDDVCVYAQSDAEHDKNLHLLMQRAHEKGLVFNSEKCVIKTDQIPFFGNLYTAHGLLPDPEKIRDIRAMPTPGSRDDLQRFLGLMTYLSAYIPNYSSECQPLRDLLKKDVPFLWDEDHQTCFEKLKLLISTDSCLAYYDASKPLTLEVDASQKGLGAALLQEPPIAYASKSLTPTQSAYSNIEREALGLVHGVQRFHTYLYGRRFTAITDHKPLVMIHQKPITSAPPRLQRMFLKLAGYDFDLVYKPGPETPQSRKQPIKTSSLTSELRASRYQMSTTSLLT